MTDLHEDIKTRTGTTDDEAYSLQSRAENKVYTYLRYKPGESLMRFASTIADIAVMLHKQDQSEAAFDPSTSPVKSESFSEGGVSVKNEYVSVTDLSSFYTSKVSAMLEDLKPYRRAHIVGKKE